MLAGSAERPIKNAHSAETTPAKTTYQQISHGSPPPSLSSAVAMMGVIPEAKMPEFFILNFCF